MGRDKGTSSKRESSDGGKKSDRSPFWRTEGLPEGETGGPDQSGGAPRSRWPRIALVLLVGYLILFGVVWWNDQNDDLATIPYTDFTEQVANGNVKDVYATGESIEGTVDKAQKVPGDSSQTYHRFRTERPVFAGDDIFAQMVDAGVTVRAEPVAQQRGLLGNLFWALLPWILIVGVWIWIMRRGSRMMQGGGLGGLAGLGSTKVTTPVQAGQIRTTFADVAGIDEVKAELTEVVDYLTEPEKYRRVGAKLPRGVLLTGQPGTGKTLLARAVAGEARVPFFSASAAEFIEMIVGVGASRIREMFAEARKVAPAIIFIDEIDTIGRQRGGRSLGGSDEREQTLNQILTEMDGFTGTEGIVVIAATNRPDVLDPALLRPGRFDRTVTVNPPDSVGRAAILEVHTRSVPLAEDVHLDDVARQTPGMTGADLANLVNEAALLAAKHGRERVATTDFADALEKVQLGTARSVVMPAEERRRTAYHESGHALLGMVQPGADPVRKISIIPRGRSLGATLATPEQDRYGYEEPYLRGRIVGALGGMAAEEVVFGVISTGAENDLEQATSIARQMVGRWGMSVEIGPVTVLSSDELTPTQSAPATLDRLDTEVRRIIEECHVQARDLLTENRDRLDSIAEALLRNETLEEESAYAAAGLTPPARPDGDAG
ncbi:ATP-dependent zinc metalloprotease FtsH [Spiractinospora alimapuensis]|uniref:ATP-dependent zinc metalloprotease FtsH n=1 Tax=Spiractinospora alimapuensis TaxID=2820884 RepID=UPI001EEBE562|nr:ATP-dependent zinc metalloprotease FtsH [Spiractinospora alimapuensis]QVQ50154.1 ATP-dependent zinc metalloprotease FtsH [Spiractinospora alimapuensis]